MLQFNTTICTITARFTPRLYWRFTALFATSSTQPVANETVNTAAKRNRRLTTAISMNEEQRAKFNELKATVTRSIKVEPSIAYKIQNAQNVHDLLDLIKMPYLSQKDILNVMSTIINWIQKSNTNVSSVQNDKQFVCLEEQLIESRKAKHVASNDVEEDADFSEYMDLSTSMMIQEVSKMRTEKNRNVKLIRFLFDNILKYNEMLNIGQCSNLVFSMCALSYPDKRLLDKISTDVKVGATKVQQSSLVSIIKSMAMLRYKNEAFLSHISERIVNSKTLLAQKYITNILQSFALLGYDTAVTRMIIERYLPDLPRSKFGTEDWLNFVWALAILKTVQPHHLESVLKDTFITELMSTDVEKNAPKQLKLLNLSGVARYIRDYNGPLLNDSKIPYIVNSQTKQKELYTNTLQDTLKIMLPERSFTMNVNTNMGFLVDAECCVDSNFKPIDTSTTENKNLRKVAIMLNDYSSFCLESNEFDGIHKLYDKLLRHNEYRVLNISYKHFGIEDKILKRMDVLKRRMQSLK
ncbi:uncharacterized protein LOC143371204 isoform X2 [Andrena cerasifolii]|uniref:uncharacterized protein LOC143371204 isoform X2 n=1 Tax=Andrena cerasifolii TaxID=2819439 RepID=UPI004037A23C